MSVYEETEREIESLNVRPTAPGQVAAVLALAAAIDAAENATSVANAVREYRMLMGELHDAAPLGNTNDSLDEIAKRRTERRRAS